MRQARRRLLGRRQLAVDDSLGDGVLSGVRVGRLPHSLDILDLHLGGIHVVLLMRGEETSTPVPLSTAHQERNAPFDCPISR